MSPEPRSDASRSAEEAGLRWISDEEPGITRRRRGRGFSYSAPSGRVLSGRERERCEELAIPPAWTDVWICPSPRGHLQATGVDEAGRKQYLYHPRWREVRDRAKFDRLRTFGSRLPKIRRRVEDDLSRRGLARQKVVAAAVAVLDDTLIRLGHERYRRRHRSHGLTTLRRHHLTVEGSEVRLRFRGKGGAPVEASLRDRRLAALLRRTSELPGQELFTYRGDDGETRPVDSGDVNAYLRECAGEGTTAKEFRTWGATLLAMEALYAAGGREGVRERQSAVTGAIEAAAERLANTTAVCRSSYVHPAVVGAYDDGSLVPLLEGLYPHRRTSKWMDREERVLLDLLAALEERG